MGLRVPKCTPHACRVNAGAGMGAWHESLHAEKAEAERFLLCYTPWREHGRSQVRPQCSKNQQRCSI